MARSRLTRVGTGGPWLTLLVNSLFLTVSIHAHALLVAAQNFEYKITNILDKPTESLFGYISVLVRI